MQLDLNFTLFIACYILGFTILAAITKQIRQPLAFLLLIPILVMSFDVMLYNNEFVSSWVPLFSVVLSGIYSLLLTLQNPNEYKFSFLQIPLFRHIDLPFQKWSAMYRDLFQWKEQGKQKKYGKIIWGIAIAIPILFVFGALFAEADEVFANLIKEWFTFEVNGEIVFRIFKTFLITLFLGSIFYVLIGKHALGNKNEKTIKLDNTVVGTILALVNALFLIFVIIQFKYLFGSADYILSADITFANYARKGFFQLAWVIILAAIMLIFFYRSAVQHGSGKFLKFLKILLVVQVLVIAVSALHRMNLYQDAYGYTVKRLYVEWFIYFSMLILVISGISLAVRWPFRNFLYSSMILGTIALTVVASINVDRMIAKENVDRYLAGKPKFDMRYLIVDLSIDALPEIKRLDGEYNFLLTQNSQLKIGQKENVWFISKHYRKRDSWREFNFGYEQGQNIINEFPKENQL